MYKLVLYEYKIHYNNTYTIGIKKYIDYINTGELKDIVSDWVYNPPRFYDSKNGVGFSVSIAKSIGEVGKIGRI